LRLRHVGLQGFGLLAKRGFLAIAFLVAARVLGPARFGDFTYITTWMLVINLIAALGLPSVTTREVACRPEEAKAILRSTLWLRIALACIGALLFNALFDLTPIGHAGILKYALLLSLALPAIAIADQLAAYVLGFNSHQQFASINMLSWGAYLIATCASLALGKTLGTIFVFQLIAVWIAAAYFAIAYRHDWFRAPSARHSVTGFMLRQSAPIAITGVLGILSFRIGTFLLYKFLGPAETGIYTSALQVVEGMQFIPRAITGALFPTLCRAVGDQKKFTLFVEWLFLTLAFLGLGAAATASVVGPRLIVLIFGSKFSAGGGLLAVLVWALVPMFLHFALTYVLIATNRQKVFVFESAVYLVVSFSANFIFIPRYGIMGAAYAALASECTLLLMHLFFVFSRLKIRRTFSWLVVPAAIAISVVFFGSSWKEGINSVPANAIVFGVASCALFSIAYWFYHHASSRVFAFSTEGY
jgi:O-antigen/teichoic acid export membrane protein